MHGGVQVQRRSLVISALILVIGGRHLTTVFAQPPVQRVSPVQQAAPGNGRVPQPAANPPARQQPALTSISTKSIGETHQLVGPLGLPLGEMVTVTLQVEAAREKTYFDDFVTVTAVGGRGLKQPVRMPAKLWEWGDVKSLKDGELLTARVYQDGGMIGVPGQALNETRPVSTVGHHFATWLVIVKSAR